MLATQRAGHHDCGRVGHVPFRGGSKALNAAVATAEADMAPKKVFDVKRKKGVRKGGSWKWEEVSCDEQS